MRIPDVSADSIREVVEGLSHGQPLSGDEVADYIGKSKAYASNVLIAAEELGLVRRANDAFFVTNQAADLAKSAREQSPAVFKRTLLAFDPFVIFTMLVVKRNSMEDAARKVKVVFRVTDSAEIVLKTLRTWGTFSGVLVRAKGGSYKAEMTAEELEEHYLSDLREAIQDELKARVFIASKLNVKTFAYLSDKEKRDAVAALMKYQTHPDDALKDIGNCLEAFLIRLGTDNKVTTSQALGLEQLGQVLKDANVILEQHRKLCAYHAVFRNAADHGLDKVTKKPWRIEPESALEVILSTLTTIRSIYSYATGKDQVL